MKKMSFLAMVLLWIGLGAACTINFPYDARGDFDTVQVVMQVSPDDADVLLNGRLIGSAYEFSTLRSALRLGSRRNELVFKKKGYVEAPVDLSSYSSRTISLKVNLELQTEKTLVETATIATDREADEAYAAETETTPALPPTKKPAATEERSLTAVLLTVTPVETAIYIDGKFWGLAPEQGKIENLRLKPGKYLIEAFKPGFTVFKKDILVPKAIKFDLAIVLQK